MALTMMLTLEESIMFCEKVLGIADPMHLRKKSPLQFLNQTIKLFHLHLPFQNITLLAKSIGSQDVPTWPEIKDSVMCGFGGLCYTNNVFMKHLLMAFEFDVNSVASCCNPAHPNNHILSIVHHLVVPGDLYLVDVGCGYPTFEAIPLDFPEESPVYHSSFLSFKFLRKANGIYERWHLQDFRTPGGGFGVGSEEWKWFYDFTLTQRQPDFFEPAMSEVYSCRFLKKLRILQFKEDNMLALKEDHDSNGAIFMDISHGKTRTEMFMDDQNIIEKIGCLLKSAEVNTIVSAVKNWKYFKTVYDKSS